MADDDEHFGWNTLMLAVDQAVLNVVRNPELQNEIMRALNIHRIAVMKIVDGIRRAVFGRKTEIIVKSGMCGYYAA